MVEVVIPANKLDPNMEILVHRSAVAATGNRYVRAYSGDPQLVTSTEITPSTGTNEQLTLDSAVVGFRVGTGNIQVPKDIYLVFAGQYVKEISMETYVPAAAFDSTPIDAVRGAAVYADYQIAGTTYAIGDKVFEATTVKNYRALEAIAADAGAFDPTKWRELSVEALDAASATTQVDALRGASQYPTYVVTGQDYAVDDKVFEPITGKNYKALEIILAPAGAFDPTKWQELSIEAADREITAAFLEVVSQINEVRGATDYADYDTTLNYVVGNKAASGGKAYICIQPTPTPAGAFDPLDWRELSIEELDRTVNSGTIEVDAIRGAAAYAEYDDTTSSYTVGDRILESVTRLNYEAMEVIGAPAGAFDPTKWRELSVESASDPYSIRDALQRLPEADRLSGDNVKTTSEGFLGTIRKIARNESLTNGDRMSASGATELAEVMFTGSRFAGAPRTLPQYSTVGSRVGISGGTSTAVDDPTQNSAIVELIIPRDTLTAEPMLTIEHTRDLNFAVERRVWLYDGDALSGGVEIEPIRGQADGSSGARRTTTYLVPSTANDIHFYFNRQAITEFTVQSSVSMKDAVLQSGNLQSVGSYLAAEYGLPHAFALNESIANSMLENLGVGAYFRTDASRGLPFLFNSNSRGGFYTVGWGEDETLDTGLTFSEIVIPANSLQHNQTLSITRNSVTGNGNVPNQRIYVYAGDPVASVGTLLSPIEGAQEEINGTSRTMWDVSTTPNQIEGNVATDLHIVIQGQAVFNLELVDRFPVAVTVDVEAVVQPLRGSAPYADFSNTSAYTAGDYVHRPSENRDYTAIVDVAAGNWNVADWEVVSLQANNAKIDVVQSTVARNFGGDLPADHNTTTNYTKDDFVYRPTEDKSYQCIVTSVTGAFQPQFWREVDIMQSATRLLIVEDEAVSLQDQVDVLRGSTVYPDYDPARPTVYAKGSIVHEPTNGKNYRAVVEIPANAGAFDGIGWDEMSVQANNDPLQIAARIEELTGADRINPTAIDLPIYHQIVYVSNSGVDTNNGRAPETPVLTLNRAKELAALLPITSKVIIECQDGSLFTGGYNAVGTELIDLYLPNATLTGDLDINTLGRTATNIGTLQGDVYLNSFNHHHIGQLGGDIIINDTSSGAASVTAKDLSSGAIVDATANGAVYLGIEHVHAAFIMPNWLPNNDVYGFIGNVDLEPAAAIRDKLNTLVEVERLPVDSVDGAADMYSRVTQAAHGFTTLQPVSFDGTAWVLADNTSGDTTMNGIICSVADVDNFRVLFDGKDKQTAHGLTVGEYYWLGAAGALEIVQPTTNIIQQALFVLDDDTVLITIGQAYSA